MQYPLTCTWFVLYFKFFIEFGMAKHCSTECCSGLTKRIKSKPVNSWYTDLPVCKVCQPLLTVCLFGSCLHSCCRDDIFDPIDVNACRCWPWRQSKHYICTLYYSESVLLALNLWGQTQCSEMCLYYWDQHSGTDSSTRVTHLVLIS